MINKVFTEVFNTSSNSATSPLIIICKRLATILTSSLLAIIFPLTFKSTLPLAANEPIAALPIVITISFPAMILSIVKSLVRSLTR